MKALDLLPFPHKLPYKGFNKLCVAFTLFPKNIDLPVLENMASLMGMKVEFSEGKTTHLVYKPYDSEDKSRRFDEDCYLCKSSKIQTVNRTFEDKQSLKLVRFDWFLSCIMNGEIVSEEGSQREFPELLE